MHGSVYDLTWAVDAVSLSLVCEPDRRDRLVYWLVALLRWTQFSADRIRSVATSHGSTLSSLA